MHRPYFLNGEDLEYGVSGRFSQEQCEACGLVAMVPMPDDETILRYYPKSYHGYQHPASKLTRWLVERNLRKQARMYRKLIGSNGTILDVGAGHAAHFDVWKKEGEWELVGFEFNDEIARDARSRGRNVATATIETFDAQGKAFDLIIMNHLLEHVTDPLGTLRRAYALLKPGGFLVGEVPNLHSWDRMMAGVYWGGCHWPRHLHQFTPMTLRALFKKAGFVRNRIFFLLHTSHWALSIQNYLQSHLPIRTQLQNGRAWYYPALLVFFIPLNFLQRILHVTGIMGFVAQKSVKED